MSDPFDVFETASDERPTDCAGAECESCDEQDDCAWFKNMATPYDEPVDTGPKSARDLIKHRMIKKQVDGSPAWKDGWAAGYLEGMSRGKKEGYKMGYARAQKDLLAHQLPD